MKLKKLLIACGFLVLAVLAVSLCACYRTNKTITETGTYYCETQPGIKNNEYCKIIVEDENNCRVDFLCSENGTSVINMVNRYKKGKGDNKFQFFKNATGDKVCLMCDNSNALWGQYKKGESVTFYGQKYNMQK